VRKQRLVFGQHHTHMTVYKTPQNRRPPWIVNMLGHAIRPGGLLFWGGGGFTQGPYRMMYERTESEWDT
jgi:hypothetical protein